MEEPSVADSRSHLSIMQSWAMYDFEGSTRIKASLEWYYGPDDTWMIGS